MACPSESSLALKSIKVSESVAWWENYIYNAGVEGSDSHSNTDVVPRSHRSSSNCLVGLIDYQGPVVVIQ